MITPHINAPSRSHSFAKVRGRSVTLSVERIAIVTIPSVSDVVLGYFYSRDAGALNLFISDILEKIMLDSPMFNIICAKHVDRNMRAMKNSVDPHNAILRP